MLHLISVIALLVVSVGIMFTWTPDWRHVLVALIDAPSLLQLLLFDLTILIGSGLQKDLINALRLLGTEKREGSEEELRRALEAVCLLRKASVCSGFFFLLFETVPILMVWFTTPSKLGPMLAVAVLTNLYAQALSLLLLPAQSRLRLKLETRRRLRREEWEERQERLLRLYEETADIRTREEEPQGQAARGDSE